SMDMIVFVFFCSSRRRHTRFSRDWSSDVCSSDLGLQRARVRAIALRAEGLGPAERASHQLTFDPVDEKVRRLEEVADRARAKFRSEERRVGKGCIIMWYRHDGI